MLDLVELSLRGLIILAIACFRLVAEALNALGVCAAADTNTAVDQGTANIGHVLMALSSS
ncbi:MAG: hypothetical protein ACJASJ_000742 [Candidatus Azotimanducaceae bacterium]|jgi:hypothetical protein|tara:strand:+ start:3209 stop:3388 length:180 start_codon:yes stop_codon:yes gene_type:complete